MKNGKFRCKICGFSTDTKTGFIRHFSVLHADSLTSLQSSLPNKKRLFSWVNLKQFLAESPNGNKKETRRPAEVINDNVCTVRIPIEIGGVSTQLEIAMAIQASRIVNLQDRGQNR